VASIFPKGPPPSLPYLDICLIWCHHTKVYHHSSLQRSMIIVSPCLFWNIFKSLEKSANFKSKNSVWPKSRCYRHIREIRCYRTTSPEKRHGLHCFLEEPVQRWGKVDVALPQGHRLNPFSLSSIAWTLLIVKVNYQIGLLSIFGGTCQKKEFYLSLPSHQRFLSAPFSLHALHHRRSSNGYNTVWNTHPTWHNGTFGTSL